MSAPIVWERRSAVLTGVARTIYPEVPPRVEYRLTDLGRGLTPVFLALADWADARNPQTEAPSTGELARLG